MKILLPLTLLVATWWLSPTDFRPTTFAELQGAVNSAALGDTITLNHSLTYTGGHLSLPAKSGCTGASVVTIQSDDMAGLPAGVRVGPASTAHMPTLVFTDGAGVVTSGGCYRLQGLHLTNNVGTATNAVTNIFVDMQGSNYVTFDRGYVHPRECPNSTPPYYSTGRFGVASTGDHNAVTNSDFRCFYGIPYGGVAGSTAWDSNGVSLGQGGPVTIANNYFETWFNGVFAGGSDTTPSLVATVSAGTLTSATLSTTSGLTIGMQVAVELNFDPAWCERVATSPCWGNGTVTAIVGNTVSYTHLIGCDQGKAHGRITIPDAATVKVGGAAQWQGAYLHDVTITGNWFHQPTEFATWQQVNNGNHPKGYMEIKQLNGGLISGNYCDGFYSTIGLAAANQSGGSPWVTINNVTITSNWLNGINQPLYLTIVDPYYLNTNGSNIVVTNNLFTKPDVTGASGVVPQLLGGQGGSTITIAHNTYYAGDTYTTKWAAWDVARLFKPSTPNVVIRDNIIGNGNYGFTCGQGAVSVCWPSVSESKNLFVFNVNPPNTPASAQGFVNSLSAASYDAVLWINKGGSTVSDWQVQAGSPAHLAASDGTDIGVDVSALQDALAGGLSPSPTPTPSPAFPSPTPTPTPVPSPSPSPTPPTIPCSMSAPDLTMPQWATRLLTVILSGTSGTWTLTAVPSNAGQLGVSPQSKTITGTSAIVPITIASKKQSASVTVTSPCGTKQAKVTVQ